MHLSKARQKVSRAASSQKKYGLYLFIDFSLRPILSYFFKILPFFSEKLFESREAKVKPFFPFLSDYVSYY